MAADVVDEIAERLARLCTQAGPDLRKRAVRYGVGDVLVRLVTVTGSDAAAAPGSPASPADLRSDLDRLDEAFARHGIDGLTTGPRAYQRWPGADGHPMVALWACPAAQPCARLVPGDDRPRCALLDEPFVTRRIQL
jgi:hypothetical protein